MQILLYNELNPAAITGFAKWRSFMEADDLKSADVKKIGDNLYRARLNRSDRLLLAFYHYQGERYALVLEYLKSHDYQGSRFLNHGVVVDEDKIPPLEYLPEDSPSLAYINPQHGRFNLLDKIISFDETQQAVFNLRPPMVIIGSAGSGKTALTLEKLKACPGDVLYVTLSSYLVKNSRDLYYAHGYDNPQQHVDFLSFQEFLESIQIPVGKPINFREFADWFSRLPRPAIKDAHKLFEEFKGVLTGPSVETAYLSREEYLNLGIKQSIFLEDERAAVYDIFSRYLTFLQETNRYDSNLLSHRYLKRVEPRYDFVVVDEVQDLTNIQLFLILKALRDPTGFLLCGDSNQIVHPNFFSWSKLKSLFYTHGELQGDTDLIRILSTNYRNSPQVTALANRILLLKNARFGAIDRESNYLVHSNGHVQGDVVFLQDRDTIRRELDAKTRTSTRFAVVVMHAEQKAEAQQHFNTPLVFSIQEAKGLEYDNIILYNFLSSEAKRFHEISKGVSHADLQQGLSYARAKDKTDKSLETYKFYINALYVALTRAVRNLYWIEADAKQRLLDLLGLDNALDTLNLDNQGSSHADWQREAHKLELQGKQEQAERIRREILQQQVPDWEVYSGATLDALHHQAIQSNDKKARLALFEIALVYEDRQFLHDLLLAEFKPARHPDNGIKQLQQKYYLPYQAKNPVALRNQLNKFGVDFRNPFNQTPLMVAAWLGNSALVQELTERDANTALVDNNGFTAFQIALQQASKDEKYARQHLGSIYQQLEPDSLSIQIDGRLLKLDKSSMEFFLLNLLIALFYRVIPTTLVKKGAFTTQAIIDAVEHFPNNVLAPQRKQRAYLSSILSKNEMSRLDRYNRKLFYRLRQGHYTFNPTLMLLVENNWVNIYDLLKIDKLAYRPENMTTWWDNRHQEYWDNELAQGRAYLHQELQRVRTLLLNDALAMLKILCEQELHKIRDN
ncbi:UvrD-helicase domain-containing protein [Thiothrix lacustris]|uniref:UvrD-helicase domain-containing protein n=1 Tax=Thiothrix lacustris TaxID=525917 RepID=UPI000491956F|nr:UvrD-helicase domain-containing protein [Thiothrix lacustris]